MIEGVFKCAGLPVEYRQKELSDADAGRIEDALCDLITRYCYRAQAATSRLYKELRAANEVSRPTAVMASALICLTYSDDRDAGRPAWH